MLFIVLRLFFLSAIAFPHCGHADGAELPCLTRDVELHGRSMMPLFADGTRISTISGGTHCAEPLHRDNAVMVRRVGHDRALLKVLKGLPGDRFAVSDGRILINGAPLTNSVGVKYNLTSSRSAMLELYVRDYGGIIPPDTVLVLGDNPVGSTDSTVFGLVPTSEIIGKVIGILCSAKCDPTTPHNRTRWSTARSSAKSQ